MKAQLIWVSVFLQSATSIIILKLSPVQGRVVAGKIESAPPVDYPQSTFASLSCSMIVLELPNSGAAVRPDHQPKVNKLVASYYVARHE